MTPALAIAGISVLSPAMLAPAVRSSRTWAAKMSGCRGVVTTAGFGAQRDLEEGEGREREPETRRKRTCDGFSANRMDPPFGADARPDQPFFL